MVETIELRRKEFEILETLGEHSFKVSRKGKLYFLKYFNHDPKSFDLIVENERKLKITGVSFPKLYMYDPKDKIMIMDYIDGPTMLDIMLSRDLIDDDYKRLFEIYWYAKHDKLSLDCKPHNFRLFNEKLYYIPFILKKFSSDDEFLNNDFMLWDTNNSFLKYIHNFGLDIDSRRVLKDADSKKKLTLTAIKYFR